MSQEQKDYSSISPSAKLLLMMKGLTDIPFAKEAATLAKGPEVFDLDFDHKDFWFWVRVMHFESRYKSIDQLLGQIDCRNILELSSGFSFRGLDMCSKEAETHYIDTDLPDVVKVKQDMIAELNLDKEVKGKYELAPLNALDEHEFTALANKFEPGALTIVNEGLLMYLDVEEKKRLCKIIHKTLKLRGGQWITADIYVKRSAENMTMLPQSEQEAAFLEQHHIEENKFDSYESARTFFREQGFEVVKEAIPDNSKLTSLPHLIKMLPEEVRNSKEPPPKIQATWMLKAI